MWPMRHDLPSGTVTFLFTDVEGSTNLLHELGTEAYATVLAEHRRIVREAFEAHGGVEVDTQGDAFFIAFPTAPGALRAAEEARQRLGDGPIRIRIGVHTGTPLLTDEGYVGVDVHRAARIAAAGHGGQVLVSASTAPLVELDPLRDLGEHRLKDLSAPERIYQFGGGEFPPLKSLHQTNLPVPATAFLGREREVAELAGRLGGDGVRLVTLTGPGGSGKTRLALQSVGDAADAFPGGVWWVPLATLRDSSLVLDAVAQALGASADIAEHIGDKRMLLLFDNFEQLIDAAPVVARLLRQCPRLTALVTSREPLHIEGEWEYAVDPLEDTEAVALFDARARAARHDFVANGEVRKICARLDNLPLAIELAAARVKVMSPSALLERLERRLPTLAGGTRDAPERQRTLRATIQWSHDLLSVDEQTLFRRLGAFVGGATFEAAETVCEAELDTLASLVDKSLVRQTDDRFWMLETIREYANERLEESDEGAQLRGRHAQFFLGLVEEAEPHIAHAPKQWLERLDRDHANIRAALDWLESSGATQLALRLTGAAARFWQMRGYPAEGRRRLESALTADDSETLARSKALYNLSLLAFELGDIPAGIRHADEALTTARATGDVWGSAYARFLLGQGAIANGEFGAAQELFAESVRAFQDLGDEHLTMVATFNLAWMCEELGDKRRAADLHEQNLRQAREAGNPRIEALSLTALADRKTLPGEFKEALSMLQDAYLIVREVGDRVEAADILSRFAALLASTGKAATAARLLSCNQAEREQFGGTRFWVTSRNDETLARIRAQLDDAVFNEAWDAGKHLSVEEAVALAVASSG
jgi:predicted ATPase/class 3 adenylate cyclase